VSTTEIVLVVIGTLASFAIGSFTCVIIDRLPLHLDEPNQYGESWDTRPWNQVLGGHSRCSTCGEPVRAYDNIPVVSWLLLRGRCRGCGDRIPAFHPMVELLCPALFLAAVYLVGWDWRLLPVLWLIPVGVAISVIDLRTLIVPTRLVWPAVAVAVVLAAVVTVLDGQWQWLLTSAAGVLALAGPLFLIWFIVPKGMGFGDVRLAVLLGWTVGFYAGSDWMGGILLSIICLALASFIGLVIGLVALGARGRKAKVPFGPALVISAFFCIALAPEILEPFGVYALS
jgi:leader peptidase (prepilin peptidase)/N-methyltransferase